MADPSTSFPRQHARTQRFTLGEPRNAVVSSDGHRIAFLRSAAGDDPLNALWVLDVATSTERLVGDPLTLLDDDANGADLPPQERARRERAREGAGGITSFATDATATVAAFALGGRLFAAGLVSGKAREIPVAGPVFDPRPDPTAQRVAYVSGNSLCIGELDGRSRVLAGPLGTEPNVSWGSADFIAAEEMNRFRGYWWSPDGQRIAACRVDTTDVDEWTIADPANPDQGSRTIRYPAAGTTNPHVTMHIIDLDGDRIDIDWDVDFFPYVTDVSWTSAGLLMHVQSRDQRGTMSLLVDPDTGATAVLGHDYDDAWIELVPGSPQLLPDARLVSCADRDGVRRMLIEGEPVTPTDVQVRAIGAVSSDRIRFTGNRLDAPEEMHVFELSLTTESTEVAQLTTATGMHALLDSGPPADDAPLTTLQRTSNLEAFGSTSTVTSTISGTPTEYTIVSHAETPAVTPNLTLLRTGDDNNISVAVLLPHDHDGSPLPVLLDPYGGPHALRVTTARNAYLTSQWFADQGFAVVVADGRGAPGRGSDWERTIRGDFATAPLDDQVTALQAAADAFDVLDLSRVAIRGWSFGGYLAALAVLRRPDVFHAAIAGAPVIDWKLYDTHYTERYLGDPNNDEEPYTASSIVDEADKLTRPLLLIHGLADDNVVSAHTLRMSSALLAAGKPHEVLPLVGVSHMTPQEVVAENLLLHQLNFLRSALWHHS